MLRDAQMTDDESEIKRRALELIAECLFAQGSILPAGATHEELQGFENRSGVRLPPKLADMYRCFNAPVNSSFGWIRSVGRPFESCDVEMTLNLRDIDWRHRGWIPFANDGCGNDYVVPTRNEWGAGEPVVFFDTIESVEVPSYVCASDVWRFLLFSCRCEIAWDLDDGRFAEYKNWPFDQDLVMRIDPQVSAFEGVTLPWRTDSSC